MKHSKISKAIGNMDDDLIVEAENKNKPQKRIWGKWAVAACLGIVVISISILIPFLINNTTENTESTNSTNPNQTYESTEAFDPRYKSFELTTNQTAIVWSWDQKTIFEKYTNVKIGDEEYQSTMSKVEDKFIGTKIGNYHINGYDFITDKKYTSDFEVYQIDKISQSKFIAAKMENSYYVFKNIAYEPPTNLGKLFEDFDLSSLIKLEHFSENGDGTDKNHYSLNDDERIWEILSNCKDAPFISGDGWSVVQKEYISFTITSNALGIYKRAMYITTDGYLWTNAFDYAYIFEIGKDTSAEIIKYAKDNSASAEYEPYYNTIVGEVTGITDEYVLIDDSILCRNPEDGITYKVTIDEPKIKRYVTNNVFKIGDTVQVSYEGAIDKQNSYAVTNAVSIEKAYISYGDVSILE